MRLSTLLALGALLLATAPSALAQPANDSSPDAIVIGANITSTTQSGTNVGATDADPVVASCQSSDGASVWWRFTPTVAGQLTIDTSGSDFDTVLSVYDSSLPEIACDDDGGVSTRSRVEDVQVAADQAIFIRIAGYNNQQGSVSFTFDYVTAAAPANDDIANAQVITGTPSTLVGTNVGATRETDFDNGTNEPEPACQDNYQATIWYSYTAPIGGDLTVDTAGTGFDTILSFTSEDGLTEIACSDDFAGSTAARIEGFAVDAGQTVLIRVAGFGDSGIRVGDITLSLALNADPANDDRADAIVLTANGASSGNNYGATVEADEPASSCGSLNSSVWYSYTAPAAGLVSASTLGSTFDTLLSLHDAADLSEIACNDDDTGVTSAVSDVAVAAGQTILIRVAEFGTSPRDGFVELDFEFMPTVSNETDGALETSLAAMPNPMRGSGRVALSVETAQDVRVEVLDMRGRRVATLHDGAVAAGTLTLELNASSLPSGVYVVRAVGETVALTERLTVVR